MPECRDPETLPCWQEQKEQFGELVPERMRSKLLAESPIEIRLDEPENPLTPEKRAPVNKVWFKAAGKMPDNPGVHKYLLAYASDFNFLSTALYPHGVTFLDPRIQLASPRPRHVVSSPPANG